MKDRFGRTIDYLRISVTDRCNLRCRYCVPPRGTVPVQPEQMLSVDEIADIVRAAVELGFRKFRLTGGEPLMRPELVEIVRAIAAIEGVEDLAMTTNGMWLAESARELAEAGLMRVNVSLDTVDPERYVAITRCGSLESVFDGLEAAREAGLTPAKLNCVVETSTDEPDARMVARFAAARGFEVRFIQRMDLETGQYGVVEQGGGGDCPRCNRLRLTCDGRIKPCLFSDLSFDTRTLGAAKALCAAIDAKPESGRTCTRHDFCAVGG